jgi:beta-glucanase (GH16 family)
MMNQKKLSEPILVVSFLISIFLWCSCSKAKDPDPEISIQDGSQLRSVTENSIKFYVVLSKASANIVSADYSFTNGTAVSPGDFTSISGTLTIPANQTLTTVLVPIKADPLNTRQPNLQFTVELSNPKFCTIKTATAKGTIICEDGSYLPTDNTGYSTPLTYPGYTLAWSDEFSGTALDESVWNREFGNGSSGWGNNELEYYTGGPRNILVTNGNLVIEARKETMDNFNYTSARLTTQGKKTFKFGRIDIRAKLPAGKGIWPALWMLGSNISSAGWPGCGEIDIMELIGTYPSRVTGTMHWKGTSGGDATIGGNYNLVAGDFSQLFHVFSLVWAQDKIKWYVDDKLYLSGSSADTGNAYYPFNADQFFIFNVAVGGNWPGTPDPTTTFPQRMFADYIRVFQ